MAEYIEREAAINKRRRVTEYDEAGFSVTYSGVPVEEINNIPAADVVEVVRCKDCKSFGIYQCSGNGYCTHNGGLENPDPDDFCSYGERKETDEHGTV